MLALLTTVLLVAAACGGGGDDSAKTKTTGDPHNITIWAPKSIQKPFDAIVARFKKQRPEVNVQVTYGGPELRDRMLQGEKPDIYVGTGVDVNEMIDDKTLPDEKFQFATDVVMQIVSAGNPKQIADLSVFGLDPLTTSILCNQNVGCGRTARAVLGKARVTASPDVTVDSPKDLVQQVAAAQADSGLVLRSDAVGPRQKGKVEYVAIPSASVVEVPYMMVTVVPGAGADIFTHYVATSSGVPKILAQAGLAPLPGDPQ